MARTEASFVIKATDETQKAFRSVKSSLTSTTAKVTALVGAAGMGALVTITARAANENYNYARALKISNQELAAWGHAANTVSVGQEKMNDILKDVSEKIGDAYANNAGEAVEALERLNLSSATLAQLSPDQQLLRIAEQLDNVGTQAERIQILESLASDASLLLPLLENDAERFKELREDAIAFGTALTEIDATKMKAANDAFARTQGVIKGVATTVLVELSPYLEEAASRLANAAKESDGFKNEIRAAVEVALTGVAYLGDVIRGLEFAFDVARVAATGFAAGFYETLDGLQKAIISVLNLIPGVALEPIKFIEGATREAVRIFAEARAEMDATAMKPMPSIAIKQFLTELDLAATARAEAIANANGGEIGPDPAVVEQAGLTEEFIEEHNERVYELQAAAEEKRAKLIKAQRQAEFNLAGDIFQNLASLMGSEHRKEFELGKKAAIAGALVKGYQAVVNSYEKGTEIGGPVVGAAFAATAAIATKAQIDAIRRQQFQGGGGSIPNIPGGPGNQPNDPGSTPPINPLANQSQSNSQPIVNVTVIGNVVGIDDLDQFITDSVRRGIDKDEIIVPRDSMNGLVLQGS